MRAQCGLTLRSGSSLEDRVGKTQIVVYDDVMRLNKAQTLAGEFWLPGEPERKCSGRLSISENGELELTVKGKLEEDFSLIGSCDINYSKIFGDVETGDPVVLDEARLDKIVAKDGLVQSMILKPSTAFIGGIDLRHSESVVLVDSVAFSFEGLKEWAAPPRMQPNPEDCATRCDLPAPEVYNLQNGLKLAVYNGIIPEINKQSLTLTQTERCWFEIYAGTQTDFKEFQSTIDALLGFCKLATGADLTLLYVQARNINQPSGPSSDYPTKIYYSSPASVLDLSQINPSKFCFSYRMVAENFEVTLKNWMSLYEENKLMFDLHFTKFNNLAPDIMLILHINSLKILQQQSASKEKNKTGPADFSLEALLSSPLVEPYAQFLWEAGEGSRVCEQIVFIRNQLTRPTGEGDVFRHHQAAQTACRYLELIFMLNVCGQLGFDDVALDAVSNKFQLLYL